MRKDNQPDNPCGHSEICDRLLFLREKYFGKRGKRKFATALELPLSTYATYEAGRTPPPEILVTVSRITGCSLDWLMTGRPATGQSQVTDPEVSEILARMEKLIAVEPKARQAVTALMDLLSSSPSSGEAGDDQEPQNSPAGMKRRAIIPILGRAAAGLPAYWETGDEEYARLASLIHSFRPEEIRKKLAVGLIDPVSKIAASQADIVHFTTAIDLHPGQIDGVILASGLKTAGKLFAVSITGESMLPKLAPGDYVIADSGQPAEGGQLCLAEMNDHMGPVCKIFYPEDEHIRLSSLNPQYAPIEVSRTQVKWAFKVAAVIKR